MFFRFVYMYWIFVYEFCSFYLANFFRNNIRGLPRKNRIELVKTITHRLEEINIVYLKIFQSLCLEQGILYENEKEYLMKYTDSVPYNNSDIDFEVLDKLEETFGIYIENKTPINSGIVGIVFKGINKRDNDKAIIVKMLKKDIVGKYYQAYEELKMLTVFVRYIPYLNTIDFMKMVNDSKESILNQTDFIKESNNIEYFKKKFENNKDFIIPDVYKSITEVYPNIIVMSDITGLKYNDIKQCDTTVKYEFAKLLNKFGYISILYNSCINGDFHAGNIFFYINENENSNLPKYQLGVIDYGLCYFPSPENQQGYFKFFYDIQSKKNYNMLTSVIPVLVENKEYYYKFSFDKKQMLFDEVKDCIKTYANKNWDVNFINNLSRIFKSYKLLFTKEFNNICMSLQVSNSLAMALSKDLLKINDDLMNEFVALNKAIEIDDD